MPEPAKKLCPECDKELPADAKECPFCHIDMEQFTGFSRLMNAWVKSQKPAEGEPPASGKKKGFDFSALAGKKK